MDKMDEEQNHPTESQVSEGTQPPNSPQTTSTGERLKALEAELEEAKRERGQFKEMLMRTQADLQNLRRRNDEERQEMVWQTYAQVMLKLMPVLDDYQHALNEAEKAEQHSEWVQGIALIHKKLLAILENEGLKRIEAEGNPFDPWEHEAIAQQESAEHSEGTVLSVIKEGYKLRNRVLRPAQVVVAKNPHDSQGDSQ